MEKITFFNVGHRVFTRLDNLPAKQIADCESEVTAKMICEAMGLSAEIFSVVRSVEKEMEASHGALH